MPLPAPTTLVTLVTDGRTAMRLADALGEHFDPEEVAVSAFEIASLDAAASGGPTAPPGREGAMGTLIPEADEPWRLELHFGEPPDEAGLRALVAELADTDLAAALRFERVEARDWVAASLDGLNPVEAGRFRVHGAHDRHRLPAHRIGIEIEAALAFGTGHHGTTRGCLELFEDLLRTCRPRQVVDIGTGTGVLAIAAAKRLRQPIAAGEIDPDSVAIAADNARINGVGNFIRPVQAAGLGHAALRGRARYDLVFANILARPLARLAPEIARATAPGGHLVLSGLLPSDRRTILAAYRTFGFRPVGERRIEGWVALHLAR